MKHALIFTAGVIGLAIGSLASPTFAQTTANGPYYAPPSWDQTLPAATRFIVLLNFASLAVLDRETGVVWERSPQTFQQTWDAARLTCLSKTVVGRKGWRLPSITELTSLIDFSASSFPAFSAGHPFTDIQFGSYWSATTDAFEPAIAWRVNFLDGAVGGGTKTTTRNVWCVRGTMTADAY